MKQIDLSTGNANPETFPANAFADAAAAVIPSLSDALSVYPGSLGHEGLRRLMAQREFDREGVAIDPETIMLTNGAMQGVTLCAQTLCTGRNPVVVMEEFCYPGTINAFEKLGLQMVGVPLDANGMRADALAETMKALAVHNESPAFIYVLPTYQNPTGAVMSFERRQEIAKIAERHDCVLVEDNCYGDVHFEGDIPPAFYALAPQLRQVYLCSLSKILAPGIRLGYLTATPELFEQLTERRLDAGPNTFAAAVTHAYLRDRLWNHVEAGNRALKTKRDALLASLERHLGNVCTISKPAGGLFVWVGLPDGVDPQLLAAEAEARGVLIMQGASFHVERRKCPFIRLAFGHPDVASIEEGISRLADSIQTVRQ